MRRAKKRRRSGPPPFFNLLGLGCRKGASAKALIGAFCNAHSKGNDMSRLADRLLLACCASLLPLTAHAAGLSIYLRNYYTEYQVVRDCSDHANLSAEDAAAAKDAMAKIEAYYLGRDASINKDKLVKQAVSNKNQAFKMMKETSKVDAREFCRGSLNDLVSMVRDIEADAAPKKSGS
jgi:hypothetical protein